MLIKILNEYIETNAIAYIGTPKIGNNMVLVGNGNAAVKSLKEAYIPMYIDGIKFSITFNSNDFFGEDVTLVTKDMENEMLKAANTIIETVVSWMKGKYYHDTKFVIDLPKPVEYKI